MPAVAVVPGDGIGPEVIEQAVLTLAELDAGLEFDVLEKINADGFLRTGVPMTDDDLDRIRRSSAVLFGAIGDPRVRDPGYARGVLLRLRFDLDLYVNLRPAWLLHDRLSPLRAEARRPVDLVVVRENTEGLYAGIGGRLRTGTPHEVAIDTEVSTRFGVDRVIGYGFGIARREVCMVDKSNAVPSGGALWQDRWAEAVRTHPAVATRHLYVDTAAMKLVEDPSAFDVVVANNSYGDILSDLTAQLAGGLGTAASANLNPDTGFGLYEPVHGSAPDIAGQDLANPVGAILSGALLLDRVGRPELATAVRTAVRTAIAHHECTADLGGELGTRAAGAAIRRRLG